MDNQQGQNISYEIHFCEGMYFAAKEIGNRQSVIDNTFTEFIGEFKTNKNGIKNILKMLEKAYKLQKCFPIEDIKPSETTKGQPNRLMV